MKKLYLVILLLFFVSCVERTTSLSEINQKKEITTKKILSNFPIQLNYDNLEYKNTIKFIKDILHQINQNFYDNKNKVEAIFAKTEEKGMAQALPNDKILFTTLFLDAVEDFFTKEETIAIICHESSHILNADWTNNFRKTYSTLNYSITVPDPIGFTSGFFLGKAFGLNNKISYKEYVEIQNKYSRELYFANKNYYSTIKKGQTNFILLLLQGFPIEVEKEADRMTQTCLKELNTDNTSIINVLEKLKKLDSINIENINIRINNLRIKK